MIMEIVSRRDSRLPSRASVINVKDAAIEISAQGQMLVPMVTHATTGARGLAGGAVRMPPGAVSRVHRHAVSEIIVVVLSGLAATIVWDDERPELLPHSVGQMCYVPAGVAHCAVNLSDSDWVVAIEFRTDPEFNHDVILTPELEPEIADMVERLDRTAVADKLRQYSDEFLSLIPAPQTSAAPNGRQ